MDYELYQPEETIDLLGSQGESRSGGVSIAVVVSIIDGEEKMFSEKMACINCGINIAPLEPRSFSFNSAFGACKRCQGIGTVLEIEPSKIVPDGNVPSGKVDFLSGVDKSGSAFLMSALVAIIDKFTTGDPLEPASATAKPRKSKIKKLKDLVVGSGPDPLLGINFNDLPQEIRDAFFNGTKRRLTFRHGDYKFERTWPGAMRAMRERIENPPRQRRGLLCGRCPIRCAAAAGGERISESHHRFRRDPRLRYG